MTKLFVTLLSILSLTLVAQAERLNLQNIDGDDGIDSISCYKCNIEHVSDGVIVTYVFNNVNLTDDHLYIGAKVPSIDGFNANSIKGEVQYLFKNDRFLLPRNSTPTIELLDYSFIVLPLQISPARPELDDDYRDTYNVDNVLPIADYKGFYPYSIVSAGNIETYRNNDILNVITYPIQYNVRDQITRFYTTIKYKVHFNSQFLYLLDDAKLDEIMLNNVINGEDKITNLPAFNSSQPFEINGGLLILTTDKFLEVAQILALNKNIQGTRTTIISEKNWTTDIIVESVKEIYNSSGIEYLLIIGDYDDVPSVLETNTISSKNYSFYTDFYFACMDGDNDVMPDIHIGRIPAKSIQEALIIVNKIINYEMYPPNSSSFYSTALHCAEFQDDNNDSYEDRRFTLTSEEIKNYMELKNFDIKRVYYSNSMQPLYWSLDRRFGLPGENNLIPADLRSYNFNWDGNASHIIPNMNGGVLYVLHRDHGTQQGWHRPSFQITDLETLNNGDKLPIVFSLNCKSGQFHPGESFADRMLARNNGGAVGVYASTNTSFSPLNDAVASGFIDAIWPGFLPIYGQNYGNPTYAQKALCNLGPILNQAMIRLSDTFGAAYKDRPIGENTVMYTRKTTHLFGDPSMKIWKSIPHYPKFVNIERNNDNIKVELDTIKIITFFNKENGEIINYKTDCAILDCDDSENVSICIHGYNQIPFINDMHEEEELKTMRILGAFPDPIITPMSELGITGPNIYFSKQIEDLSQIKVVLYLLNNNFEEIAKIIFNPADLGSLIIRPDSQHLILVPSFAIPQYAVNQYNYMIFAIEGINEIVKSNCFYKGFPAIIYRNNISRQYYAPKYTHIFENISSELDIIYDISGRRILNVNIEDLDNGIYIVNGQKIIK